MTTRQSGFSLIEALVAVAIVAILASLALPNFVSGMARDQIVSAVPLADIVKPRVAAAGLPPPEKIVNNHIKSVAIEDGAIQITFGNSAHQVISGKVLTLRPAVVEDAPIVPVAWVCGNAAAPDRMTVKGENRTNIDIGYLPLNCRNLTR